MDRVRVRVAFGLNHFLSSSNSTGLPQLGTEALGLSLAALSIALPYFGRFLKLISVRGELCVRGFWNTPSVSSKAQVLDWFKGFVENIGLFELKDTLYFPQTTEAIMSESRFSEMLPRGTCSLLVEPMFPEGDQNDKEMGKAKGFVLLASSIEYAYSEKDRAWIRAVANKFGGADLKWPFICKC